MKPLQTHGKYREEWIPPRTRFWRLERSDEQWARFFDIGEVRKVPEPLYDVRDESGNLVGYTRNDPSLEHYPSIEVAIIDPRPAVFMPSLDSPIDDQTFGRVQIRLQQWGFDDQQWVAWQCRSADAPDLVRCNWVEVLGEDRRREWEHELRQRAYEKQLKTR